MNGQTFPAGYSVTPNGTVYAFVTVQEDGEAVNLRIKITPDDPSYPAALAAARPAAPVAQEEPAPVAQEEPAPVAQEEPAPVAQVEPASVAQVEPAQEQEHDAKQARGPIPEKTFIGLEIKGRGWKIVFDGEHERTRVILKGKPSPAAKDAITKAGFFWSPALESWNKKLTHKAFRAAQALALELKTICG
jgi:type IV secretory pathway VirB10-like protein